MDAAEIKLVLLEMPLGVFVVLWRDEGMLTTSQVILGLLVLFLCKLLEKGYLRIGPLALL
jgi:hypothetical protein